MTASRPTPHHTRAILALALILGLALCGPAFGATIYNNLGPTDIAYHATDGWGVGCIATPDLANPGQMRCVFGSPVERAMPITIPAGQDYYLDRIVLPLLAFTVAAGINVHITPDNGGVPDTANILETANVTAPAVAGVVNANFSGNTILTKGTTYWVWLSNLTDLALINWLRSTFVPADFGIVANSLNAGTNWTAFVPSDPADNRGGMHVQGTPYPPGIPNTVDLGNNEESAVFYGDAGDRMTYFRAMATGDVNGDGADDVILGASQAAGPGAGATAGAIYVWYGSTTINGAKSANVANGALPDCTIYGATSGDQITTNGALTTGDVNGDGLDDIIFGTSLGDGPGDARLNAGDTYVIYGDANGLPYSIDLNTTAADVTIWGAAAGDLLTSNGGLLTGDLDGDNIDDLVISAPTAGVAGRANCGLAYIIFGNSSGLPYTIDIQANAQDVTIEGSLLSEYMGDNNAATMAIADVNGDAYQDLLIGAYLGDINGVRADCGKVYVFNGRSNATWPALIDTSAGGESAVIYGPLANYQITYLNALTTGDFNGDGIDDIAMGSPVATVGGRGSAGAVYGYFGSTALGGATTSVDLAASASFTIWGVAPAERLSDDGALIAGDITGDGLDDILVGAYNAASPNGANSGEAYVVAGKSSLTGTIDLAAGNQDCTVWGAAGNEMLTQMRALALGDFDADGKKDILVGASLATGPNGAQSGEAYLIAGANPLPVTVDLAAQAEDMTVYGAAASDLLTRGGVLMNADINDDGVDDILLASRDNTNPNGANAGTAWLILGVRPPTSTTVYETSYSGDVVPRDFGTARATVDHTAGAGGAYTLTTVTLTRNRTGVSLSDDRTIAANWRVTTARTGPNMNLTFNYLESDVFNKDEADLVVAYSSTIGGTYAFDYNSVVNTEANTVTTTGATLADGFYVLYEVITVDPCFLNSIMTDEELAE